MKKLCFVFAVMALSVSGANADQSTCVEGKKIYESCKPGYYNRDEDGLFGECNSCPMAKISDNNLVSGTSENHNTGDITSCYLPAGTTGSDSTGTFEYTDDCPYTK